MIPETSITIDTEKTEPWTAERYRKLREQKNLGGMALLAVSYADIIRA